MRLRPILLLGLFVFTSCLNDKDYNFNDVTISPTFALPIAFGNISIIDLIAKKDSSYLKVYSDGLLYFSYSSSLASENIRQQYKIPDNSSTTTFDLPAGTLPPSSSDTQLATVDKIIDLGMSPEQLSEMLLKAGSLDYTINVSPTSLNLPLEIRVTLASVKSKANVPLSFSSAVGNGFQALKDYVMTMDQNKFHAQIDLILKKRSSSVFVPAGSKANAMLKFSNMDFSYIKGFLGDKTVALPDQTLDLGAFNASLKKSTISFAQPVVKMNVVNEYGVSCELTFTKIEAAKSTGTLPFQLSPGNPVNLPFPTAMGNTATMDIAVTNAGSLLDFSPTQFRYSASTRINKGLSSGNNFIADGSKLRITLTAEVPLYGKATGISMVDTLGVDLKSIEQSDVSSAALKISGKNELPLDINAQIYMTDDKYHVLDSLFKPNQTYIIKASTVTGAGELQAAGTSELQIGLDTNKLSKIFSSKYLIIKSTMNTAKDASGAPLNVKFKSSYKLQLNIGLLAKMKITAK